MENKIFILDMYAPAAPTLKSALPEIEIDSAHRIDLAEKVIKLTNSKSHVVMVPYLEAYPDGYEDMQRRVPDTSKLNGLTGWNAKFGLDQAIIDIAEHLRNEK